MKNKIIEKSLFTLKMQSPCYQIFTIPIIIKIKILIIKNKNYYYKQETYYEKYHENPYYNNSKYLL